MLRYCASAFLTCFVAAAAQAAPTIDGDPSDWTGLAPTQSYEFATSGAEWIYRGAAGDAVLGAPDACDLTELRLQSDATDLYILVRVADLTQATQSYVALGFATDPANGSSNTTLGDESGLLIDSGRADLRPDMQIALRIVAGTAQVELSATGGANDWSVLAPADAAIAFGPAVEARVSLASLGLTASATFRLVAAAFFNDTSIAAASGDATGSAALDVISPSGLSGNATARDLGDGDIDHGWQITLSAGSGPVAVSECPPGTSCATHFGAGQSCASGHYSEGYGGASCSPCAPGQALAAPGSSSAGDCVACAPGSYSDVAGAAGCTVCPSGHYAEGSGNILCAECLAGSYVSTPGSDSHSDCLLCDPGSFASSSGSAACAPCDAGRFSPVPGATICDPCPAGAFQASMGEAHCAACLAGTFTATTGQTICSDCNTGKYSPLQGASGCLDCPAGTISPATGAVSACAACAPGTFNSDTGATACVACAAESYSAIEGAASCEACPSGTHVSASASGCEADPALTTGASSGSSSGSGSAAVTPSPAPATKPGSHGCGASGADTGSGLALMGVLLLMRLRASASRRAPRRAAHARRPRTPVRVEISEPKSAVVRSCDNRLDSRARLA